MSGSVRVLSEYELQQFDICSDRKTKLALPQSRGRWVVGARARERLHCRIHQARAGVLSWTRIGRGTDVGAISWYRSVWRGCIFLQPPGTTARRLRSHLPWEACGGDDDDTRVPMTAPQTSCICSLQRGLSRRKLGTRNLRNCACPASWDVVSIVRSSNQNES